MKQIIAGYILCGILTAEIVILEKSFKGEFNPYNADEDDEEAIGNIVLLWWLYLYYRLTKRSK